MLDARCLMLDARCLMLDANHTVAAGGRKMTQSYRDLEVYQLAHQLGVELHRLSLQLPKYELYEAGSPRRNNDEGRSTQ
jgi:hypothetical protein